MSLNLGQLRQTQLENDSNFIFADVLIESGTSYNIIDYSHRNSFYNEDVVDKAIILPEGALFKKNNIYDVTVTLNNNNIKHTIIIKLYQKESKESETVIYKTVKIVNVFNGRNTIQVIFTPDYDYDYLVFEVQGRENLGFGINATHDIEEGFKVSQLTDIIKYLSYKYNNFSYIQKFGLQGPVGLKFSLNQEEFQLNSTGMFTLEDVNVSQLAFSINESNTQPFIMDFQY